MSRIASQLRSAIRQGRNPIEIEFAKIALQFLKDGDDSILDSLPDPQGRKGEIEWMLINLMQLHYRSWTEEDDVASRFKFEIWRRGAGTQYREIAEAALAVDACQPYFLSINGDNTRLSLFLDRLRNTGMDEVTMARVLVQESSRYLPFQDVWFASLSEVEPLWRTEIEAMLWRLPDEEFVDLALNANRGHGQLWSSILRFRPKCEGIFVERLFKPSRNFRADLVWRQIIRTSPDHDGEALLWMSEPKHESDQESLMNELVRARPADHLDRYLQFINSERRISNMYEVLHVLAEVAPRPSLYRMMKRHLIGENRNSNGWTGRQHKVIAMAAEDILGEAKEFFELFLDQQIPPPYPDDLQAIANHAPPQGDEMVYQIAAKAIEARKENFGLLTSYWSALRSRPSVAIRFRDDFIQGLADARLRSSAKYLLVSALGESGFQELVDEMWRSKDEKKRLIGIRAVAQDASQADQQKLLDWLAEKPSRKLSGIIHELLVKWNVPIPDSLAPEPATPKAPRKEETPEITEGITSFARFEAWVAVNGKRLRLPRITWCDPDDLPPVVSKNGEVLSKAAVRSLIALQSKLKEISGATEAEPVFGEVDRTRSAPFANALLEGFLNSDQSASDRWALTLGGLLGDNHVIMLVLPRINDWCENSRHKLAEYAAQAIALLPGKEPLMMLDTLSNRYRSKFKNVGKACAEAFNAAAAASGITADELGDLVVPDFGFDADGVRRFNWDGGGASAELGADFKLSWFDPETDKSWKALPAGAPEAVKTEVKTLGKLMREMVKAQTARLEMMLVRQRRWPVARWRELFENHPLLRPFASNLVWGVYDGTGRLLRTFRRYSNGILADAGGVLEELTDAGMEIGMVHPLELEKDVIEKWRSHLGRFKVKPPFPQLDRSVEQVDPLHGNRREITVTKERQLGAGTFRSRAEKRGWVRGSVVDAGGISSYYKVYPGAGVEVILPTEDFWVICDPMDPIRLGGAWFVKAGSVERGSYTYDEPKPDDPRVLRFEQVPAVVYSETIGDLKAIIATKE